MDWEQYKQLKELSVTGHAGSSIWHVCFVLWYLMRRNLSIIRSLPKWSAGQFVCQFCVLVLPYPIIYLFPHQVYVIYGVLGGLCLLLGAYQYLYGGVSVTRSLEKPSLDKPLYKPLGKPSLDKPSLAKSPSVKSLSTKSPSSKSQSAKSFSLVSSLASSSKGPSPRLPCISYLRAYIMVMTVIAILAVDFASFPNWLAKTESFGTSMMDVGIANIVFSAGLVGHGSLNRLMPFSTALHRVVRSSAFISALGVVRCLLVKLTGYQEHVSEYGVHWNFFLTLSIIPVLALICSRWIRMENFAIASLLISTGYEIILKCTSLQTYLLSTSRDTFISMNKEGLFGLVGTLSLYLFSCQMGSILESLYFQRRRQLVTILLGFIAYLTCVYYVGKEYFGIEPSRRLMNLSFVLFGLTFNLVQILALLLLQSLLGLSEEDCSLLKAINQNLLILFLLGNLFTGLINLSFQTLLLSRLQSLLILVAYCLVLCSTTFYLAAKSIIIRFK